MVIRMKLYTCRDGVDLACVYNDFFGAWSEIEMVKFYFSELEMYSFEVNEEDLVPKDAEFNDFYPYYVKPNTKVTFQKIKK